MTRAKNYLVWPASYGTKKICKKKTSVGKPIQSKVGNKPVLGDIGCSAWR